MNRAVPIVSPMLWGAGSRLAIAASTAAGLWLVVGWALDWWK
ncbi:hypothetical protein [Telmatospirillum siberiense]|nr:hypothetical protein [Telmatospirillum siberiense]